MTERDEGSAGEDRAGEDRAGEDRAGEDRAGEDRAGEDRAGEDRAGEDRADEDRADALFHSLADRTRRDIMRRVLAGEHSVSALAASYDMSFAAVQKHVAVLERAGLITKRRIGREALASGDVEAVRSVTSMLAEIEDVWRGRIARIDELLLSEPDQKSNPPAHATERT